MSCINHFSRPNIQMIFFYMLANVYWKQVSVSTFKLNKVEFLQQSMGYSSSMKVQVGNITNEDCSSIPWDEFQVSSHVIHYVLVYYMIHLSLLCIKKYWTHVFNIHNQFSTFFACFWMLCVAQARAKVLKPFLSLAWSCIDF